MTDRVFTISGDWALASDGLQWILQRRYGGNASRNVSFVRSTKEILARCMREAGLGASDSEALLSGLPLTFDEWKASQTPS